MEAAHKNSTEKDSRSINQGALEELRDGFGAKIKSKTSYLQ